MCRRITLIILFLFLTAAGAFAATFTVTSNADAGPGTLREALTKAAANGTAEKDYIYFNLPGTTEAARTIILLSDLPYVSSNVVIDGTTQSGSKISPGDAKVTIIPDPTSYYIGHISTGLVLINVTDVAIYGLSINHFDDNVLQNSAEISSAIDIIGSKNITLGAPGKGNMFDSDEFAIYNGLGMGIDDPKSYNMKVQSNIFGVHYPTHTNFYCDNLLFGGDGPLEGNHLSTLDVTGDDVKIIHNYLGVNANGDPDNNLSQILGGGGSNFEIRDNISNKIVMWLSQLDGFKIIGNTDISSDYRTLSSGLHITNSNNGIIGSEDITKQNVFHGDGDEPEISIADSKNIQLFKNSIRCSTKGFDIKSPADGVVIPDIRVLVNSDTEYSGTASPGSKVYIYEDNSDCPICNPVQFYAEVIAGADAKWKVTGNFKDKKMLSNALLGTNSSEFTTVMIPFSGANEEIILPTCGKNNGSIALSEVYNAIVVNWYNANGEKVGQGQKLENVGAGSYYAIAQNGNCSAKTNIFTLQNLNPEIYDDLINVTNPSCGKGGSITGLAPVSYSGNPIIYTWTDKQNNVVGHETDITGLHSGEYTFTMRDEIAGCELSYGPVVLKNTTGPNIDQSASKIQPTNCGQSTGSITNLTVTGTGALKYVWLNSQQQPVGSDKDLLNQPAGIYRLQVSDNTNCGLVYADITIPETNGITLDESKVTKTIASCGENNGTITGITATGATKYQWTDSNNKIVSGTTDLTGVPSGDYRLTVSNNFGCSKTSQVYHVDQQAVTQFPQYAASETPSCYQKKNGSITVTINALVKSVRWVNSSGDVAGNLPALTEAAAGTYKLYLTDQNGCEQQYNTYIITELPEFKTADRGAITNDQCNLKTGSVSNVIIAGGEAPYTYQWTDAGGNIVGTDNSIDKLAAGNYTLQVIDSRCGEMDIPYTLTEESAEIAPPSVSNVRLCSSGNALLSVNNSSPATTYRLYETGSSANLIDEKSGGYFNVTVSGNRSYFISQLNGTCESSRAEVKVAVGLSANDIANAFTPNADGINDYWKISNIESYPDALVQVFTRYGQKVFESRGYVKPFDGTMNGKLLPTGVYYYIINLNTKCNILSGGLTIIR